ncbi:hypothetical protein CEXT_214941 [Caerostris extrusa]|uniref:Uncharacterized protein n=1 Tax=Caerostris extrusa TaxID=172846 RepID=A0AAV4M5H3_CAEEX|nr:hypothetical protein CEXT_214941 [Caerostris extrusa]
MVRCNRRRLRSRLVTCATIEFEYSTFASLFLLSSAKALGKFKSSKNHNKSSPLQSMHSLQFNPTTCRNGFWFRTYTQTHRGNLKPLGKLNRQKAVHEECMISL